VEDFSIEEKDKYYIVMEYCDGGTLKDFLDNAPNNRLSYKQAQKFFKGLINALIYLQEKSMVHRDIKPDNIMLTTEGEVKLADFSVAIILNTSQVDIDKILVEGNIIPGLQSKGAPAYQAPECHSSGYHIHTSAHPMKLDIWSSGIVLYVMVVGKFPFNGSNVVTLFESISKGNYEIPDWIDDNLRSLLTGIININPESRYNLDEIKKHPWMKIKFKKENIIPVEQIDTILGKDKVSLLNTVSKFNSKSNSDNSNSFSDSKDETTYQSSNEESTSVSNNDDIDSSPSKNRFIIM